MYLLNISFFFFSGNIIETAPETWGDCYNIRESTFYDEKSDVFSYAIILWRLFVELPSFYPESGPYPPLAGPKLRQEIRKVKYEYTGTTSAPA